MSKPDYPPVIPDFITKRYCPTSAFHWKVDEPSGKCPVCKRKIMVITYTVVRCMHRAPLNYDRTRYAYCTLPSGHAGRHEDDEYDWTNSTMPARKP